MWTPFHFESNQVWGMCKSQERWNEMKSIYLKEHQIMDLNRVKLTSYIPFEDMMDGIRPWDFGTRREYTGDYTLAQFAKHNNMNL